MHNHDRVGICSAGEQNRIKETGREGQGKVADRINRPDAKVAMMKFINRENGYRHSEYTEDMKQYEMMKAGDPGAVEESHRMMAENDVKLADDPVTNMKYLFICNATLMTRFAIEGGLDSETAYNASDLYIYNTKKCVTAEEVLSLHREMVTYFTRCMQNLKKENVISIHISKCLDYIDQHLHEKILLTDLAGYTGLNLNYLSVLFKKETGMSVSGYILNRRLQVAENMLRYSEYSCAEISSFLAFHSQSHFIKAFRRKNGITPKKFRDLEYNQHFSQ